MSDTPHSIRIEDIISDASNNIFRHLSTIVGVSIDLRYASANNFVGRSLYGDIDCAWLHRDAAHALENAAAWLKTQRNDVSILVLDALRPQRIQEELWASLAGTELHMYLAEPSRGSIHSFGMAVDVTLIDADGRELDMGTPFDDMTELSHPALEESFLRQNRLTKSHLDNRALLRNAVIHAGFQGISSEWWHFNCGQSATIRAAYQRVM
jgi:zinc D-Ala-D-Ala dipeptidase